MTVFLQVSLVTKGHLGSAFKVFRQAVRFSRSSFVIGGRRLGSAILRGYLTIVDHSFTVNFIIN